MRRWLIGLVVVLCLVPPVSLQAGYTSCGAGCYLADSASKNDVQAAVDASQLYSGNQVEVRIPAGSATYTGSYNYVDKTFTKHTVISGAGTGVGGTIITNAMDGGYPAFYLRVNDSVAVTLKDIKFVASQGCCGHGMLVVTGSSFNVVMTNLYFDMKGSATVPWSRRAIEWGGGGGGVMSLCTFSNPLNGGQGISFGGTEAGRAGVWAGNPTFGTAAAMYVEDTTFDFSAGNGDGAFDGYDGAHIAFRYNTVIGTTIGWHGADSSTGAHSGEIYHNAFTNHVEGWNPISLRGGTAVIYDNTFTTSYGVGLGLSYYRGCKDQCVGGGYGCGAPIPATWCGNNSPYDGNTGGSLYGYPCYQSPGMTGTSGIVSWPVIAWNNIRGSGATDNMAFELNYNFNNPGCGTTYDQATYVVEKRDYINATTCVGDAGAFCTTWWDDVNKKAKNYTPYTYPHPLTVAPAAPAALSVTGTTSPMFSWTHGGAGVVWFERSVDGAVTSLGLPTPSGQTYTSAVPSLTNGQHTITIRACNQTGCTPATTSLTVVKLEE